MSHIPRITLEEHFFAKAIRQSVQENGGDPMDRVPKEWAAKCWDVDDMRLKSMDKSNIAMQILSHTPADYASASAIAAGNDELADAVRRHPTRFAGFGTLPMSEPEAATKELERCIKELKFVGVLISNHARGKFFDGPEYDGFWAKAQELDTPVYLHPTFPSEEMQRNLYAGGGLENRPFESMSLGMYVIGWHAETALHIMRLMAARTFERFPRLKIVIGHSGEMLPFLFKRVAHFCEAWKLEKPFEDIMHSNIWITTSGMFDVASLKVVLAYMPLERVMYSVDYPFSSNEEGDELIEEIQQTGVLKGKDLEDFLHGNAEKLCGVKLKH